MEKVNVVKVIKMAPTSVTVGDITLKVGKGYTFNITKDKDGKPLSQIKTVTKMVTEIIQGDDGNYYRTFDTVRGCQNHTILIDVVEMTTKTVNKEGKEVEYIKTVADGEGLFALKNKNELKEIARIYALLK